MHIAYRVVLDALRAECAAIWNFQGQRDDSWRDFCRRHIVQGDAVAVEVGPLVPQIAKRVGQPAAAVRRRLLWLEQNGHVIREAENRRGTAHRWWAVGSARLLSEESGKALAG